MKYPIVVMNKFIPGEMVPVTAEEYHPYPAERSPFFSEDSYRRLVSNKLRAIDCVRLPWYDNWMLPDTAPHSIMGYHPFAMIVFTIDNEDDIEGETVIDLKALGDVTLTQEVITELESEKYDPLMFKNKYNISVFSNEHLVEQSTLTLENGTVLHIPNRLINRIYRLVLSVNKDVLYGTLNTLRVFNIDFFVSSPKF